MGPFGLNDLIDLVERLVVSVENACDKLVRMPDRSRRTCYELDLPGKLVDVNHGKTCVCKTLVELRIVGIDRYAILSDEHVYIASRCGDAADMLTHGR